MSDKDQGGFVYPFEGGMNNGIQPQLGITLRQYDVKDWAAMEMIAAMSYAMADAMIEAGKQ